MGIEMKTKRAITNWIKSNFKNGDELGEFCEFLRLHSLYLHHGYDRDNYCCDYESDILNTESVYIELRGKWGNLYLTINDLPAIEIFERGSKGACTTLLTPLQWISHYYSQDCRIRDKLLGNK